MFDFVAIDFETANKKHDPCQIGIACVCNGKIADTINSYINPERQFGVFFMSFFTFSTVIFTGIPRPEMIRASSAYIFTASIAAPPFCCIHTRAAAAVCGRRRAA